MRIILSGGFCFVHISFGYMVKFESLVQFPVDHLSHPVMPSLVLHLCWFAGFAYVINRFISVSTLPTLSILLRIIFLGWLVGFFV